MVEVRPSTFFLAFLKKGVKQRLPNEDSGNMKWMSGSPKCN